jgi:Lon protease-like protein
VSDEALPIFPLSNVVLFPRVQTPLHLFEPRYRQLARAVIEGERRIGMVVVRPEHVSDMPGDPPIYPIGCTGLVTEHNRMPDGRYNLVLQGQHRFRVIEEVPRPEERLYRVARVVRLEDTYPDEEHERVARLRASLIESVGAIVRHTQPERAGAFDPSLFEGVDDESLVNTLANAFAFPVEEKLELIEADSIPERFARLAGVLSFRRAELESEAGSGGSTIH